MRGREWEGRRDECPSQQWLDANELIEKRELMLRNAERAQRATNRRARPRAQIRELVRPTSVAH